MLCSSVHSDTSERKRKRKRDKTSSAFLPLINHFAVNDKVPLIVKTKEGLFSVSLVCHFLFHEITTWQWKKSPWQQSHLTELLNRSCFSFSFFLFPVFMSILHLLLLALFQSHGLSSVVHMFSPFSLISNLSNFCGFEIIPGFIADKTHSPF